MDKDNIIIDSYIHGLTIILYGTVFIVSKCFFIFRVIMAILFTSASIGRAFQYAPDVAKANVAASTYFNLIYRDSKIDPTISGGKKIVSYLLVCL